MKGVVFSISVMLMGLVLISLVTSISFYSLNEKSILAKSSAFHRMQDEVEYISRELIEITNIFNMSVSVNGNVVSVTEEIPFPNTERFGTDLSNWKQFVEDHSDFDLEVQITDLSNTLPLTINDQVEYKHTNGVSGNKITVEQASLVSDYSVFVDVHSSGDISFDWDDTTSGDQNFTMTIQTTTSSNTTSKLLDFSKGNELEVSIGASEIDISIGKGNDEGFFKFDNKDQLPMTLMTNITINSSEVWVNFPSGIINIQSDLYNISRVTTARIASA